MDRVLANSLVFQGYLIHIYLQDVPNFDSLILSNICDIFISSFALAENVSCYLLVLRKADLHFHIKCSGFFCSNSVFWFLSR